MRWRCGRFASAIYRPRCEEQRTFRGQLRTDTSNEEGAQELIWKRNVSNSTVHDLLDAISANFPRFRAAVLQLSSSPDIEEDMQLVIKPARKLTRVSTFERGVFQTLTPMLKSRFEYASRIRHGLDIWLSQRQMTAWMHKRTIRSMHRSRRTYWLGSAPNLYPDSQLSLFGITLDVPQNATYLVWDGEGKEPRVWSSSGMDADEYDNLEEYLRSHL
jgi:hypothetical protein